MMDQMETFRNLQRGVYKLARQGVASKDGVLVGVPGHRSIQTVDDKAEGDILQAVSVVVQDMRRKGGQHLLPEGTLFTVLPR